MIRPNRIDEDGKWVPQFESHGIEAPGMTFPVTGAIVTIPKLPQFATAVKAQSDCVERLVNVLEKVIAAS